MYNDDGIYSQPGGGVGPTSLYNPVGYAKEIVNDQFNTSFYVAPSIEIKFCTDLRFTSQLAYKVNSTFAGYFDNQVVNKGPESNVNGGVTQGRYLSLQNSNILTYSKSLGDHNFTATGVYEISRDNYRSSSNYATGIPVNFGYNGLSFGAEFATPHIELSNTSMRSLMGRLNYNYKNRYLFSFSDRYDGSSQLAEGHKYENFNAAAIGWNIMEESFMQSLKNIIPELKVRASYGQVGNAAVPAYASQMLFYSGKDASGNPTISIKQLANPSLKWERTTEKNAGVDAKLLDRKFELSIEYYDKKTKDLLIYQTVPAALGVSSVLTNVGAVSNKGLDFSIGGTPLVDKNFKWNTNVTFNYNKNKILALDGISDKIIYSSNAEYPGLVGSFVQMVGQPMGTFIGYKFAGVWKQSEVSTAALYGAKPGDAKYVDVNQDKTIDGKDIMVIGNAQPKCTYGWNNTFTYRCFDLNIFIQGVSGNKLYNQNRIRREAFTSDAFPTSTTTREHYTSDHQTDIPSFTGIEKVNSSRWVEDGSYLRFKNISVAYRIGNDLLSRLKYISSAKFYLSLSNMITVTKYTGYDPEASIGKDATAAGVDRGVYPSAKSIVFGFDVTF